jgi:hypothetical protein
MKKVYPYTDMGLPNFMNFELRNMMIVVDEHVFPFLEQRYLTPWFIPVISRVQPLPRIEEGGYRNQLFRPWNASLKVSMLPLG